MTREQVKKIAVRAINRIVTAAKELAEAEAMLLDGNRETRPATAKPARRRGQIRRAAGGKTGAAGLHVAPVLRGHSR